MKQWRLPKPLPDKDYEFFKDVLTKNNKITIIKRKIFTIISYSRLPSHLQ